MGPLGQPQPGENSVNPALGSRQSCPEVRTGAGSVPEVNSCSVSSRAAKERSWSAAEAGQGADTKAPLAPVKDQQEGNSVPAQEQVSSPGPESVKHLEGC